MAEGNYHDHEAPYPLSGKAMLFHMCHTTCTQRTPSKKNQKKKPSGWKLAEVGSLGRLQGKLLPSFPCLHGLFMLMPIPANPKHPSTLPSVAPHFQQLDQTVCLMAVVSSPHSSSHFSGKRYDRHGKADGQRVPCG